MGAVLARVVGVVNLAVLIRMVVVEEVVVNLVVLIRRVEAEAVFSAIPITMEVEVVVEVIRITMAVEEEVEVTQMMFIDEICYLSLAHPY